MRKGDGEVRRTQAERREEAERKLLEAAARLIAKKGFDGFKLAEVGEAAGYSRGLPVHYFDNKETLLVRVAEYLVDAYNVRFAQHQEAPRGLPRLRQTIMHYCGSPVTTGMRALNILLAHARVMPALHEAVQRLNANALHVLEIELKAGVELGNIRAETDCTGMARMIHAFLRGQLAFMVLDAQYRGVEVAEQFLAILEPSLAPRTEGPMVSGPRALSSRAARATN